MSVDDAAATTTEPRSWQEELASLVETTGIHNLDDVGYGFGYGAPTTTPGANKATLMDLDLGLGLGIQDHLVPQAVAATTVEASAEDESFSDQVKGFSKASAEMILELVKGFRDVVQQTIVDYQDSYLLTNFAKMSKRLTFLNDLLPEDRSPLHAWPVVFFVFLIAFTVLGVNTEPQSPKSMPKKVYLHPPTATLLQLPDGRHMAYHERGVSAERARLSLISPHSFLSSRLAGIPGIRDSLLVEFGVRLITYDLPGFGESDPHPDRDLYTSTMDMLRVADALGVNDKFWVVAYSGGAMHAWAALRYIPDRIAGAAMFAPIVDPYDSSMTKEERHKIWQKWTRRRKLMYFLARRIPSLLGYFYKRSFLSGEHGRLEEWLSLSLGKKDKSLIEEALFQEFWQRDVEESIRQRNIRPFIEEASLQVSRWGFSLADIQVQRRKRQEKGILPWLKSMYTEIELEWAGFLRPIHIWQGMDDEVVTPSTADFINRLVPKAIVHKLPDEGHLSYFYLCDECHRQIFSTLFGTPQGPLLLLLPLEEEEEVVPSLELQLEDHNHNR